MAKQSIPDQIPITDNEAKQIAFEESKRRNDSSITKTATKMLIEYPILVEKIWLLEKMISK